MSLTHSRAPGCAGRRRSGLPGLVLYRQLIPPIRADLLALFDRAELMKYLTDEELGAES